jgi:voltage-gated potassium channel
VKVERTPMTTDSSGAAWPPLRIVLRELYFRATPRAIRFQAMLLVFDMGLITFFAFSPFLEHGAGFLLVDYFIAALLAVDLAARSWAFGDLRRWAARPIIWADLAVLVSLLLAPMLNVNLGFLRILRAYSMINGVVFWRVVGGGRWQGSDVADTAKAAINLSLFIFMMTALVHTSFAARTPTIRSYMDSLYFTVTSLTTTGYGDIVLPGAWGKAVSIIIMIGGVTLFFRLVQVTMRGRKVRHPCPSCGLTRHEADAVCCKACGTRLRIAHENE